MTQVGLLNFIKENSGIEFQWSGLTKVEEQVIKGIGIWFDLLKDEEYYLEETEVTISYAKEKVKSHKVIVEVFNNQPKSDSLGQNRFETKIGDREVIIQSGTLSYSCDIRCRSTSRSAVARLADAIVLGLKTNINTYLQSVGLSILPNSVTYPSRIERVEIVKDAAHWEIPITIGEIVGHWKQILDKDGEILKDIKYIRNELEEEEQNSVLQSDDNTI